jgi:hypothetical protein
MLPVRIDQHRAIAIEAAAEEVGKVFLWYAEHAESELLAGMRPMSRNQS